MGVPNFQVGASGLKDFYVFGFQSFQSPLNSSKASLPLELGVSRLHFFGV